MPTHVGERFTEQRVVLDGEEFRQCAFTRCRVIYRATTPASIPGSTFEACGYEFEGPAANTMHFLRTLYHGMGPQGRRLVEEVFDGIRRSPADPPPAV